MYDKIKRFYDMELWTAEQVSNAVEKGVLTPDEYKEITGNDYPAE